MLSGAYFFNEGSTDHACVVYLHLDFHLELDHDKRPDNESDLNPASSRYTAVEAFCRAPGVRRVDPEHKYGQ